MARRKRVSVPAGAMRFAEFAPEDNGVPVVEQHEHYHRELLRFMRTEHGRYTGLDGFMALCRSARDIGEGEARARGEFWTTSAWDWARHVLGEGADPGEVERVAWRFWDEWKL